MGLLPFILPGIGAVNPYTHEVDSVTTMWARGAGVMVSGELSENVALTTFWLRAANDNSAGNFMDNADLGGLHPAHPLGGFRYPPLGHDQLCGQE